MVAFDPGGDQALEGMFGCLKGLGVEVERVDARACRAMEPALCQAVAGGLLTPDHQVDPEALLAALEQACRGRGVAFEFSEAVRVEAGLVELKSGVLLEADRVVMAAGAWVNRLLKLPVYPVKGEVIHLRGPALLRRNLRVQREDLYVANRGDGRYVVGATEEEVGWDLEMKGTQLLRERAMRLVPQFSEFELVDSRVGFRPKVKDGLPLLGEYQGIVVAGAHYRNGILLTPITAQLISEFVLTGQTEELMRPFCPQREIRDRRVRTKIADS